MTSVAIDRLLIALNASIPPSILAILLNAILVDKTYKPFKLIGELLSSSLRDVLRRIYVVCNVVFTVVWILTFVWNCGLNTPELIYDEIEFAYCLPVQSLSAVVFLILLWVDRITLAVLHVPFKSGFVSRIACGATCVGFIIAVSEKEPSIWFFFVGILNRSSASVSLAKRLKSAYILARIFVICILLHSFFLNTSSRKLMALCLTCTIHARAKFE